MIIKKNNHVLCNSLYYEWYICTKLEGIEISYVTKKNGRMN